jgi:hypothetical protein
MSPAKKKRSKRPAPTPPPRALYVHRLNLLLNDDQFERLHARAAREKRPLPNLVRYLIDVGLGENDDD